MVDTINKFIKAWEIYSGLEWEIDHQGDFPASFKDFKAGWFAAIKDKEEL